MSRLLRWVFYCVIFIVVVLVGGYAAGQYYKPSILEKLNAELKNSVNGDVKIGRLDFTIFEDFPNVSITLGDIYIRGPHYDRYHKDFMTAEKIYVHINPIRIFQGAVNLNSISIKNGSIFIFRDSKGYTNMDVVKRKKDDSATVRSKSPSPTLELENILFENTRFTYVDTLKHKSYDIQFINVNSVISSSDSSKKIVLDGDIFFGGITFNTERGGYLSNTKTNSRLDLEFVPAKQKLIIHPSELQLVKSNIEILGQFDFAAPGKFLLAISSKGINYAEGLTVVTKPLGKKLSNFMFDGPLDLSVNLVGKLSTGDEPKVDISFTSPKNNFVTGKFEVKDLSFKGSFTNHVDDSQLFNDTNSRITLDSMSGVIDVIHVNANLTITDLTNPNLKLNSKSTLKLVDINYETDTSKLKLLGGILKADIQYDGKLNEYLEGPRSSYTGKIKAAIKIKDGSLVMNQQQKNFKNINAQIHFTEKRMDFDKIDFVVNGNPVQLKGSVIGFIPFFLMPEKKGIINLSLYAPKVDLESLKSVKSDKEPVATDSKQSRKKISDLLDILNNKVAFTINVKANEINNGSFAAKNFSGKISLTDNQLVANPVTMTLADGEIDFSLKLSHLDKPINPVILKAEVRGSDIKKFFSSFNNFSQKTILADNLSGKVYTKIGLTAKIDDKFNVLMPTLDGEVDFKLREGELKDFEPLQRMSNFLLKKRDFTDVQFAEIKGTFHIAGQYLDVSRMEIESSVLSLFLEGRYSLGDSTDLSIQVPLSNLKRRDKFYKPENVGVDAKVGPSVFLRAHQNKDGKMVIVYNIFKKFKKGKS